MIGGAPPETQAEEVTFPDTLSTLTTLNNPVREKWPTWVHERAILVEGKLNPDALSPDSLDGIARFLEDISGAGCHTYRARRIMRSHFLDDDGSLIDQDRLVTEFSELVVRGVVMGSAGGFEFGQPGTLYKLAVTEFLKGSAPYEELYFFIPHGQVRIGSERICVESKEAPPEKFPENVEVLVSVPKYYGGDYLDLLDNHPSRVVALPRDGYAGFAWPGYSRLLKAQQRGLPEVVARWLTQELLIYGDPIKVERRNELKNGD